MQVRKQPSTKKKRHVSVNGFKCKDKYVVCRAKELALADPDPQLFTMATLTGHAVLAVSYFPIQLQLQGYILALK